MRMSLRLAPGGSWVANHQQRGTIGRFHRTIDVESCFLVGTDRTPIGRVRIGHDARESLAEAVRDKATDEGRAVTAAYHAWLTDEQVDTASALGLDTETSVPFAEIITLKIPKRVAGCR